MVAILVLPSRRLMAEGGEGMLNKLLAPGPLIRGHQDLEGTDCLKCHSTGKGVPDSKCLDCHKDIRKAFESKKGYHGLIVDTCITCHHDHKGRDFESMEVDAENFVHKTTGFVLDGKHEGLKCKECHTNKRSENSAHPGEIRYFGNTATCASCHQKEDIHFFKNEWAKKDCGTCHGSKTWTDGVRFDHQRDTGYALKGSHEDLKCSDCHGPKAQLLPKIPENEVRYKWTNLKVQKCLSCHQDFHKNDLSPKFKGGDCAKCHDQEDWKFTSFPHSVTGYTLRGKHQTIDCNKCHIQSADKKTSDIKRFVWKGLDKKTQCKSCHEDYHRFANARTKKLGLLGKCEVCHGESDWHKTKDFDHNKDTRYPIDGKHLDLKCNECHYVKDPSAPPKGKKYLAVGQYRWPELQSKTCENCHKSPHVGEFSKAMLAKKCTECHVTDGWKATKQDKNFNHSQTRFALTGSHRTLRCDECHLVGGKKVYRFPSVDQKFCIDCHKNPHKEQFDDKFSGMECSKCHSTEKFVKLLPFDHDQTRYKLREAHSKLDCNQCHTDTPNKFELRNLVNSNARDSAKVADIQHKFKFPDLDAKGCVACHADYHAGQLGPKCATCHSEKTWKNPKFDHDIDSKFSLKGKHKSVKCVDCHSPIRGKFVDFAKERHPVIRYKPLASNCSDCHSDYHGGQLSKDCKSCHSEEGWKQTHFDHDIDSKFSLKGKHAELKCDKCHQVVPDQFVKFHGEQKKLIRYKPIGAQCIDCHKDPHKGSLGSRCAECHTERDWHNISDFHKNFTLKGVHNSVSCQECHKNNRRLGGMSEQCYICHQKDDVHGGALPQCGECHMQEVWEHTTFRHSMTFFPLQGVHRTLQCTQCHAGNVYRGLSDQCISCHLPLALSVASPPHVMPNFSNCYSCHNQFSF